MAGERNVASATQAIALNSIAFLYNRFLHQPLNNLPEFRRTHKQRKLPMVLDYVASNLFYYELELELEV